MFATEKTSAGRSHAARWLAAFVLLATALPMLGVQPSVAQSDSRTFPETGKTVQGKFLAYWNSNGGLAQQGFPISEELQEKSATDGKTYTVQYFERAVFELHPENQAPYDVLLSLLGVFYYKEKYPTGAPGQTPNTQDGSVLFTETGKRLGGVFKEYWETHGGMAQQGYPISDEFTEVSKLDGKTYRVQYFERAVFEYHPENQPPHHVLLSQLGTFRLTDTTATPTPTPTPPGPVITPSPTPTVIIEPDCSGIPDSINMEVMPLCGAPGTTFEFDGWGFKPGENVGIWATMPNGEVSGAPFQGVADASGHVSHITYTTDRYDLTGIWATTMQGLETQVTSIGYWKVTERPTGPTRTPGPSAQCDTSGSTNGQAVPNQGTDGDVLIITAQGFTPGEDVSFWFTAPTGRVIGTQEPYPGFVNRDGTIGPLELELDYTFTTYPGTWALTFLGASSKNEARIFFCVAP